MLCRLIYVVANGFKNLGLAKIKPRSFIQYDFQKKFCLEAYNSLEVCEETLWLHDTWQGETNNAFPRLATHGVPLSPAGSDAGKVMLCCKYQGCRC